MNVHGALQSLSHGHVAVFMILFRANGAFKNGWRKGREKIRTESLGMGEHGTSIVMYALQSACTLISAN